MNRIFLDTNIWLRYFIRTDEEQYQEALRIIDGIEHGKLLAYTSTIVFLEIHFVAKKLYKIPENQIILWFKTIQKIRTLTLIEKTNFPLALHYNQTYGVKLADCIIASQLPPKTSLVTFDREFRKIKEITPKSPKEIITPL